jgi:release factor glutamine methyltransferase
VTVAAALADASDLLAERGVDTPTADAEFLLAHVLGWSRTELQVGRTEELSSDDRVAFEALVQRRAQREPLAYVLGEWGFRRLTLHVDGRVLVPRPETEVVVDRCLALVRELREPEILDVGTGSGAIALALLDEHPGARVTAIDTSEGALEVAAENARRLGLKPRLVLHDLEDGLPGGPYDLVVANPPYVTPEELDGLAPEVRDWEPRAALLDRGQTDGIVRAAGAVLKPGAWLVVETHWHGARRLARQLSDDYGPPSISSDLGGRERVVEAQWRR